MALTNDGFEQRLRPIRDAMLMPLHANGDDSETTYRKATLDWLLANDGRPNALRRSISDPFRAPSLR